MKLPASPLVGITLFASLVLAGGARLDAPGFRVAEGSVLAKSFRTEGAFRLEDMNVRFNGEEADPSQMGMPEDFEVSFGYELSCSDTYESVGGGRPLVLLRAFESLSTWTEDQDGTGEEEEPTDLVDKIVRFEWDADSQIYELSFVGEEGDEEDLDKLREDLDLRELLPQDDVSEGDAWGLDGIAFLSLWAPAMDVRSRLEAGEFGDAPAEMIEEVVAMIEGVELVCTYVGAVEEDGVSMGQIDLALELGETVDVDPEMFSAGGGEDQPEMSWNELVAEVELSYEGTLLWNLDTGHFQSIEGTAECIVSIDFAFSIEGFGLEVEGEAEFSMELEHSGEVSPAE